MEGVRDKVQPPDVPSYEDCSSFATWCYWTADAPDPNGLGYNGSGYTGTQVQHGHQVDVSRHRVGPGDTLQAGQLSPELLDAFPVGVDQHERSGHAVTVAPTAVPSSAAVRGIGHGVAGWRLHAKPFYVWNLARAR